MVKLVFFACLTLWPLVGPKADALMEEGCVSADQNNVPLRATLKSYAQCLICTFKICTYMCGPEKAALRTCILM